MFALVLKSPDEEWPIKYTYIRTYTNIHNRSAFAHAHDAKHVLSFVEKISGPKRSIKITDHSTCTSANVIYCITWILCKFIDRLTGRRLGDRFREHLRDAERDDKNASKLIAGHFNLPNYSKQHMAGSGHYLHQGSKEGPNSLEQKIIF